METILAVAFAIFRILVAGKTVVKAILFMIFTRQFKKHGAIMNHSESLLYSEYSNLSFT